MDDLPGYAGNLGPRKGTQPRWLRSGCDCMLKMRRIRQTQELITYHHDSITLIHEDNLGEILDISPYYGDE